MKNSVHQQEVDAMPGSQSRSRNVYDPAFKAQVELRHEVNANLVSRSRSRRAAERIVGAQ